MNVDINSEEYYKIKVKYEILLNILLERATYSHYSEELSFDDSSIRNVIRIIETDMYKDKVAELKGKDNED